MAHLTGPRALGFQFAVPVPPSFRGDAGTARPRIDDDRSPAGSSYLVEFGPTDLFERTELGNGQRLVDAAGRVGTHGMLISRVLGRCHVSCSGNRGRAAGKKFYLATCCPADWSSSHRMHPRVSRHASSETRFADSRSTADESHRVAQLLVRCRSHRWSSPLVRDQSEGL